MQQVWYTEVWTGRTYPNVNKFVTLNGFIPKMMEAKDEALQEMLISDSYI